MISKGGMLHQREAEEQSAASRHVVQRFCTAALLQKPSTVGMKGWEMMIASITSV